MKRTSKLLTVFLALCMVMALVPLAALADIHYIPRIHVSYTHVDYKAGDTPRATAKVTEGNCSVAFEYWRELEQKEAGSVWTGTGRYWYSDPAKMASLAEDKRITKFEAGHHYSYNIVLTTDSGYFINDDSTVVSVGDHEWGVPGRNTNLGVKEMSTRLNIYGIYAIDLPEDTADKVITAVSVVGVNKTLDASAPVSFTAKPAADQYDIVEEAWEAGGTLNDVIKSTDAPRAPIAGGEYWYSIVLKAKDGYVFSKDFADEKHFIREGSGVTFTLGGTTYDGKFHVSDDGKTLTAWEFMDPITAKAGAPAATYAIVEGANSAWAKNTDGTLTFRANGDLSKFSAVKVDDSTVAAEQYTVVSGSTVVTLKKEFLDTLSVGKHTLTVVYSDGACSADFEIQAAQAGEPDKPAETGDSSNPMLWIALLLVGGALVGAAAIEKKKKLFVK